MISYIKTFPQLFLAKLVPFFAHRVTVRDPYFNLIKEGQKSVEGRLNKERYAKINSGDYILFQKSTSDDTPPLLCRVSEKAEYQSFREMLQHEGVENCLPGVKSIEEGVRTYHQLPHYKQEEERSGVVAFRITLKKRGR